MQPDDANFEIQGNGDIHTLPVLYSACTNAVLLLSVWQVVYHLNDFQLVACSDPNLSTKHLQLSRQR